MYYISYIYTSIVIYVVFPILLKNKVIIAALIRLPISLYIASR